MIEEKQGRQKKRWRLWWALGALMVLLAVLFVPPFLSVSRYKSQITSLMASSLGRPVHLSSMRVRLLPRPGFVLYDLTVEEDPAFGAEPLLHANTVTASIRLLSLWRGKLELGVVSVDEASLNLVRSPQGNWNLDSLFRTSAKTGPSGGSVGGPRALPFPYLAATNSRVNFKSGSEKLPFSIVDTDLSFWQENPGEWRLRLRGQPARTDVSLNLGDTGIVELNATVRNAAEIRQMPIHLDAEWRNAQLGQLTRLVTGSDSGWRGDMRGDIQVEGTAASAQVKARLRATDVHRAEFQPVDAMDFDANCGFVYRYSERSVDDLVCDSPLGKGHVRLGGTLPGYPGGQARLSVELDRVPVEMGLDALRTVRSGVDPSLEASGAASGKFTYDEASIVTDKKPARAASGHLAKAASKAASAPGPLAGSVSVEGFQLNGGGLSQPIQAPKLVLAPAPMVQGGTPALVGTVAVPMGGPTPLSVNVRLGLKGYQVGMKGDVSITRGRELARATGIAQASQLNSLAGDPVAVDLIAEGPWMPAPELYFSTPPPVAISQASARPIAAAKLAPLAETKPDADTLTGTVTLRNANWKSDYLVNHVGIAAATLHVNLAGSLGESRWDAIDFTYGPLKGTASITVPAPCDTPAACPARFDVQFADLDAAIVQTAILGAREKGTLLSDLINRLRPTAAPAWPELQGTVKAGSLLLGPVTLKDATAVLRLKPGGAEITSLDARLLGGTLHANGTMISGDKPAYALEGNFEKLNPVAVGQMLGQTWRGGTFEAKGKVELAGYTGDDLASSAKGMLHFEWSHGTAIGAVPPALARFDRWMADAAIAGGKVTLGQNMIVQGSHKLAAEASVPLTDPPRLVFPGSKQPAPKKAAK